MAIKAGDRVNYVPDMCHATRRDASGEFPFAFGVKEAGGEDGEAKLKEVKGKELHHRMRDMRTRKKKFNKDGLHVMHPTKFWDATVRSVNDDGTVNIDVAGSNSGVTLHCDNVRVDTTGKVPHTVNEKRRVTPTAAVVTEAETPAVAATEEPDTARRPRQK